MILDYDLSKHINSISKDIHEDKENSNTQNTYINSSSFKSLNNNNSNNTGITKKPTLLNNNNLSQLPIKLSINSFQSNTQEYNNSIALKNYLNNKKIKYEEFDINQEMVLSNRLKIKENIRSHFQSEGVLYKINNEISLPQIKIGNNLVCNYEQFLNLERSGLLEKIVYKKMCSHVRFRNNEINYCHLNDTNDGCCIYCYSKKKLTKMFSFFFNLRDSNNEDVNLILSICEENKFTFDVYDSENYESELLLLKSKNEAYCRNNANSGYSGYCRDSNNLVTKVLEKIKKEKHTSTNNSNIRANDNVNDNPELSVRNHFNNKTSNQFIFIFKDNVYYNIDEFPILLESLLNKMNNPKKGNKCEICEDKIEASLICFKKCLKCIVLYPSNTNSLDSSVNEDMYVNNSDDDNDAVKANTTNTFNTNNYSRTDIKKKPKNINNSNNKVFKQQYNSNTKKLVLNRYSNSNTKPYVNFIDKLGIQKVDCIKKLVFETNLKDSDENSFKCKTDVKKNNLKGNSNIKAYDSDYNKNYHKQFSNNHNNKQDISNIKYEDTKVYNEGDFLKRELFSNSNYNNNKYMNENNSNKKFINSICNLSCSSNNNDDITNQYLGNDNELFQSFGNKNFINQFNINNKNNNKHSNNYYN